MCIALLLYVVWVLRANESPFAKEAQTSRTLFKNAILFSTAFSRRQFVIPQALPRLCISPSFLCVLQRFNDSITLLCVGILQESRRALLQRASCATLKCRRFRAWSDVHRAKARFAEASHVSADAFRRLSVCFVFNRTNNRRANIACSNGRSARLPLCKTNFASWRQSKQRLTALRLPPSFVGSCLQLKSCWFRDCALVVKCNWRVCNCNCLQTANSDQLSLFAACLQRELSIDCLQLATYNCSRNRFRVRVDGLSSVCLVATQTSRKRFSPANGLETSSRKLGWSEFAVAKSVYCVPWTEEVLVFEFTNQQKASKHWSAQKQPREGKARKRQKNLQPKYRDLSTVANRNSTKQTNNKQTSKRAMNWIALWQMIQFGTRNSRFIHSTSERKSLPCLRCIEKKQRQCIYINTWVGCINK